jgi:hypothetical protein
MTRLLFSLLLALAPSATAATYLVTVNTSSINPTAGALVLDYSTLNAQSSFAAITGFTGATLGAVIPPTFGTVTGDLTTNDLILTATNPGTNYAINSNFNSNSFSFTLSLYGPAVDTPDNGADGTTFSIQILNSTLTSGLLTLDGTVGLINIAGNGTITTDGLGFTTFDEGIPEPSTFLTMAVGVAVLAFARRRK